MLPDLRVRQRDFLLEISRALTQELNLERLLLLILRDAAQILAGQAGVILLRSDSGTWAAAASHRINPTFLQHLQTLLTGVSDQGDPARFEIPEINRLLSDLARNVSLGLLSGVGLPLIAHKRVIGVIFIFRSNPSRFSGNDRVLLQSFADQAAIAVYNAQLYSRSQREQHRMNAVLDSVADGMLILTSDHVIERCNPAFANLLGIPIHQIQGKRHGDVIKWAKRENGLTLDEAEAGGWPLTPNATFYLEGDLARPEGGSVPVGVTYAPMMTVEGTLLNIITTVRDITRFREADELKSTFMSVISHELKTPVALIKGYASTLRRSDVEWDPEIIDESLKVIEEESDRLAEMIENLLDATRLQAGGLKLNQSDVSLPRMAERLAERFRTQVDQHTITVDFDENYPVILADEDRIRQVISNLISNAIKYAPDGGEIEIIGQTRPNQVILCIRDEGPGIAPGDIPHIFNRFFRSDKASRTTKGAGLGLFLSRAVIEAHGGRIWVDPKTGDGARICFSLPRQE